MLDVLLRGGSIVDGTGQLRYESDLGILEDRIVRIGKMGQMKATTVIDASGKMVSPGFIDIHQHSDLTPLINRRCESSVRQGITTAVIGNCGHGCAPISDPELVSLTLLGYRPEWGIELNWHSYGEYLDRFRSPGVAVNFFPLVAHGVVRMTAMGLERRAANPCELDQMRCMVAQAMEEGATGLSTGLEYFPGKYADTTELKELAKVVGRYGGIYASHIRNRADTFVGAVEEALDIGEVAGLSVQLSHLAPRPYTPTGVFEQVLEKIYDARNRGLEVAIDTFPDTFGPGPVAALLPEQVCEGHPRQVLERLRDENVRRKIQAAFTYPTNYLLKGAGVDHVFLSYVPERPDLMGKSLAAASELSGQDVHELVCDLLLSAGENFYNVFLEHLYATEDALHCLMREPICALGSDGIIAAPYGPCGDFTFNPSSYGYTARVLERYVREKGFYTLEDAVRRMTGLPATVLGLSNRGLLQEGWAADVVVFDPLRVRDNTTREHPNRYPDGIETVIVNGTVTVHNGEHTGALNGRILKLK